MFLRIEFESDDSLATRETKQLFFGSPNGMCLSSTGAFAVGCRALRDAGRFNEVAFWYVNVAVLNRHYGGVLESLKDIRGYPGVKRVDVLPLEGDLSTELLDEKLMRYVDVPY